MALTTYPGVVNWDENQLPNLYNDPLWLATYGVGLQGAGKAGEVLSGANPALNSVYKRLLDTTLETERKTAATSGLTGSSETADRLSKAAERVGTNWALTEPEIASKYEGLATTPTNQLINWTNALRKENQGLDAARQARGDQETALYSTALGTLLSDLLGVKTGGATGTNLLASLAGTAGSQGLQYLYKQIFGDTLSDADIQALAQISPELSQSGYLGSGGTGTAGAGAGGGGGAGAGGVAGAAPVAPAAKIVYDTLVSSGVAAAQASSIVGSLFASGTPAFTATGVGGTAPFFITPAAELAGTAGATATGTATGGAIGTGAGASSLSMAAGPGIMVAAIIAAILDKMGDESGALEDARAAAAMQKLQSDPALIEQVIRDPWSIPGQDGRALRQAMENYPDPAIRERFMAAMGGTSIDWMGSAPPNRVEVIGAEGEPQRYIYLDNPSMALTPMTAEEYAWAMRSDSGGST